MRRPEPMDRAAMEARGWRIVIGGVILHLTLGTLYCFGNIQTYLVSYMRAHAADSADLRKSDSTWIFTLATTGQAIAMFFGGRLEQKIGPRWTVLLGGWITSGAVALTALTCSVSKWLVFLTYGLLFGIGVGLCYTAPFVCAMRWMPHRSGVVSGFVVAGFGGGAAIFDQVQTLFVNPHNIKPEIFGGNTEKLFHPHDVDRVPYMFLLLACIYAVMQLVAAMMMSNPPTNQYQRFDDRITSLMPATSEEKLAAVEPTAPELPTTLAVKTRQFWTMWFGFCLNAFNIVFLSTLYKAFGETFIEDDHFLTWVGTFASIFNALGRICWGQIGDWVSFRVAIVTLSLAFGGTIASLPLTASLGKYAFCAWVCLGYFCLGGNFALHPSAVAKNFGSENAGPTYGVLFTSTIASGLVGSFVLGDWGKHHDHVAHNDESGSGSSGLPDDDHAAWQQIMLVFGGLSALAALLGATFTPLRPTKVLN